MKPSSSSALVKVALVVGALAVFAGACNRGDDTAAKGPDSTNAAGQVAISLPNPGTPKPGGKLTYGIEAETDGFDPTASRWALSGLMVANAVFDPLAAFDENKVPRPYLAEKFEHSDDYKTWTITVRKGINFHNGQPVNAAAGKKFTDAIKNSPLTGPAARPIQSVDIVDDYTTRINMSVPWVAFPALMTGQGGMLVAPEQLDNSASADPVTHALGSSKPIGTGPFKFKEWVRDQKFVATKNASYWQRDSSGNQMPYLDEVEFNPIPEVQNRINALQAGNVNVIHDDHQAQVDTLKGLAQDGKYQFIQGGGEDEESFIMINNQEEPLKDKRLRQALAYATDLDGIETVTGDPPELRADSFLNPDNPFYAKTNWPTFNLDKAKQLVNAWKADHGGQTPKFALATTPAIDNQRTTQVLQQQWKAAGFDVELQTTEQAKFILDAVTANYQADLWRQFSAPDPDSETHWWISDNAAEKGKLGLNFARIKNAELDAALAKGRSSSDPAERKAAYAKVQEIFTEEVPYIWLHHVRWAVVADNKVHDLLNGKLPDGTPSLPIQAGVHRLTYAWLS